MIAINVVNLHVDPPGVTSEELRSTLGQVSNLFADITIRIDDTTLYEDDSFPIAEFSLQILDWTKGDLPDGAEFSFDSMFFEDPGEISIERLGNQCTLASAQWQHPPAVVSLEEVVRAAGWLRDELRTMCAEEYGIELGW